MNIKQILEKYKKLNFSLSIEEEKQLLYEYVYATNKLEGNKLTLNQTTQLLSSDTISGSNIKLSDILEQKGMFDALTRMINAVRNKEILTTKLILEFNRIILSYLWKDNNSYIDVKLKGQKEGSYKTSNNVIIIRKNGKIVERIEPLSNPSNVSENMEQLVEKVNSNNKNIIEKVAFLAQEIWLHQPFFDGNKRTGRLLINFLTMQQGFPLFIFDNDSENYNNLLVKQYLENKPGIIVDYIYKQLGKTVNYYAEIKKSAKKITGFRMIL